MATLNITPAAAEQIQRVLDERGQAIRRADQTQPGQRLKARLGEGELEVRVEDNHQTPVTLSLLD